MFNQGLYFSVPVILAALCTVVVGSLCIVALGIGVIQHRKGEARSKNPVVIYAFASAVFVDAVCLNALWSSPGDLLYPASDEVCLTLWMGGVGCVAIAMVCSARLAGSGARAIQTVAKALLTINVVSLLIIGIGFLETASRSSR